MEEKVIDNYIGKFDDQVMKDDVDTHHLLTNNNNNQINANNGHQMYEFEAEFDEIEKLADMTEDAQTHEAVHTVFDNSVYNEQYTNNNNNNYNNNNNNTQNFEESQDDVDKRSVYVGNVNYTATPVDLHTHFQSCGPINRITVMIDKVTGHPKGYAYIEFKNEDGMNNSLLLNNTLFQERQIKVIAKRKNIPGFMNGGRGSFRGRGFYYRPYRGSRPRGYRPMYRARGYRKGYGRPY